MRHYDFNDLSKKALFSATFCSWTWPFPAHPPSCSSTQLAAYWCPSESQHMQLINIAINPQGTGNSFLVSKNSSQSKSFNMGNARKLRYQTPSLATVQWRTLTYTGQVWIQVYSLDLAAYSSVTDKCITITSPILLGKGLLNSTLIAYFCPPPHF